MKAEFKRMRSVNKSYDQQGEIFFACRNYANQPPGVQKKIRDLCENVGQEYAPALLAYLTTDISWQQTCIQYAMSEETLRRMRRKFYNAW